MIVKFQKKDKNNLKPVIVSLCCGFPFFVTWDDNGYFLICSKCGQHIGEEVYINFEER